MKPLKEGLHQYKMVNYWKDPYKEQGLIDTLRRFYKQINVEYIYEDLIYKGGYKSLILPLGGAE